MRLFPILSLLLSSQLLTSCGILQRTKLDQPPPVDVELTANLPVVAEPEVTSQCPATEAVVCTEPKIKVIERVIERNHEKIIEVPVAEGKLVLGAEEFFTVVPSGLQLRSLIDSAAATTSLNVQQLTAFERDGSDWVRFQLSASAAEEAVEVELPVKRYMRVARPGLEPQRRPFVEMNLTVGDITHMVEVNLTQGNHDQFPLLIGRNFLKDTAVVDVSLRQVQGKPDSSQHE